jgi:ubiquinone/menaquinone biosynthesis C-methylase UbiE
MNENVGLSEVNRTYWSQRSTSYSDVNKVELAGISRHNWSAVLHEEIYSHFPGKSPQSINVLDVGTGPGFFAILLAESGFHVTAVDMTPEMLDEAKQNAGALAEKIDFREMNAEDLCLPDDFYDVVVSRNLTWNLPHPEKAYSEWHRILRPGGLLLNFDSNWYGYLFDDSKREQFEADRASSAELGLGDQNLGENFDVMEDIARSMPLSDIKRPEWDITVLSRLGFSVTTDTDIWKKVWTIQEQTNFSSTPLFMISAVKDC